MRNSALAQAAFYQRDVLNSITSLSNSASALVNTYNYDSFGKLTASVGTLTNPLQYTGREVDSETGLLFDRARYLDPNLGRFLSDDPMGFDGGINFYDYVSNDPVDDVDPFGWKTCTTRIMPVTAYCSRGPGSDWPHYKPRHKGDKPRRVGPGDVAVANSPTRNHTRTVVRSQSWTTQPGRLITRAQSTIRGRAGTATIMTYCLTNGSIYGCLVERLETMENRIQDGHDLP